MLTWLERLVKSKTIVVNVLTVLTMVLAGDDIRQFISEATVIKILAAVNILLRFLTVDALQDKA